MKKCDGKNCGNCASERTRILQDAEIYFTKEEVIREKARLATQGVKRDIEFFNMPIETSGIVRLVETGESGETQPPNIDKILEGLTAEAMQEGYENALRQGKSPEEAWKLMEKTRRRLEE